MGSTLMQATLAGLGLGNMLFPLLILISAVGVLVAVYYKKNKDAAKAVEGMQSVAMTAGLGVFAYIMTVLPVSPVLIVFQIVLAIGSGVVAAALLVNFLKTMGVKV